MNDTHRSPREADWLAGGGELGALIRDRDWTGTPLGPPDRWPQSLRSAVSILLPSRAQICLFWGPDLVAIYNDAYRPALGIKHPAALGQPARVVWAEFWEDVLRPLLEKVLRTGEAFWASDHPFFLERRGYPEETYFDISYDPVRDESGGVGGVFCIVSETTGRVVGERRLRMLSALAGIGLRVTSVDAVFQQAARVLAEFPEEYAFTLLYEWDGRPPALLRSTAGMAPGAAAAPTVVSGAETGQWPLRSDMAADGVVLEGRALEALGRLPGGRWPEPCTRAVVLPIAMPAQPLGGFLVAGIPARRPFDERSRDCLRLVASAIASAVANAKAHESERERVEALAQLDRAKTAFFSNVSHEFRTPLTLLLGPLQEELSNNELPEASRRRLEVANRNGLRLLKLVNALLDFSRIEAGRMRARFEPTDLAAFTAELASSFESACACAGLRLEVRCDRLSEPAYVDRDMWEKVVLNLLSNGLKFTFEGGITVSLAERDGAAWLEVRDTGIGIPAEAIPRIFERFHCVDVPRARTHDGSGIGLALVQELVRLHGGEINARSEPGKGSAFQVRVPLGRAHLPADQVAATGRESGGEVPEVRQATMFVQEAMGWLRNAPPLAEGAPCESQAAGSARLLVVDDNADMREYLERLLAEFWQVTTAVDGEAAVHLLYTNRFDLVLTDVMMPRLDGFGLLRAIRSEPALRDLPVVMLSARAGEEARIEGREAGADDYLVKPFSARELIAQVRAQLAIARSRRSIAREREILLASERAARMEAQRQWEDLMRLFEQAPSPMVILRGPELVIEMANAAACAVWGRLPEEVRMKPMLEALPELRGQGFDEMLAAVMRTGEPYRGTAVPARFDRGKGLETLLFDFVYSPLRGPSGCVSGVIVIAHDVTRRDMAAVT